jgi:hypothetical protein
MVKFCGQWYDVVARALKLFRHAHFPSRSVSSEDLVCPILPLIPLGVSLRGLEAKIGRRSKRISLRPVLAPFQWLPQHSIAQHSTTDATGHVDTTKCSCSQGRNKPPGGQGNCIYSVHGYAVPRHRYDIEKLQMSIVSSQTPIIHLVAI